jgi:DNA polymerase-3 subunit epsilon
MRHIVFDLETTGFSFAEGHRIVEIGAIELVRGAVTGRTFHTYVNPQRDVPDGAYRVHGLSFEFLKDKPEFGHERVARAVLDFFADADLIAHNGAAFDLPFLNAELEAAGLPRLSNTLVDTLHIARRKYPGAPASLDALCARFNISTEQRQRDGHGALLDSRLLAQVYIELTGGAQAGLDFAERVSAAERTAGAARGARSRPSPLPSLVTSEEAAAHAAFVQSLPGALWISGKALRPSAAAVTSDDEDEIEALEQV